MFGRIRSEKGFGLVEVLVSIALLGIIAVAFLLAINVASRAILIADERTTAESLARGQMEYIKEQDYIYDVIVGDEVYAVYPTITIDTDIYPASFSISSKDGADETREDIPGIIGVPWDSENNVPALADVGLQRIKLVILNNGEEVLSLEDYKVVRYE